MALFDYFYKLKYKYQTDLTQLQDTSFKSHSRCGILLYYLKS